MTQFPDRPGGAEDLLSPSTRLPEDPGVAALAAGQAPGAVAAEHPESLAAWAALADEALGDGRVVEGYAYARVGYHRGLDALRKSGWRGTGRVPWSHEANRGFLRSVAALARASQELGDAGEADRCRALLHDSDPAAEQALEG